ncbi:MAG: HXXEE domain-containing protein [Actinobacteria bacterium]|jgi:hypothetical protein|nr:MAG: HXXEE domain-containing protein [Actinomycetota bacterium]
MIERIRKAGFPALAWLSIANYAAHYAEEAPRFVAWINSQGWKVSGSYTQKKFRTENALMFSFGVAATAQLSHRPEKRFLRMMALGSGVAYLQNTLFHALPTLRTGTYSPGLVTACLFNPPLAALLFWKAGQEGWLDTPTALGAVALGTLVLPVFVGFTHKVLLADNTATTRCEAP